MQQRGMKSCCSVLTSQHAHPDLEGTVTAVSLFSLCQLQFSYEFFSPGISELCCLLIKADRWQNKSAGKSPHLRPCAPGDKVVCTWIKIHSPDFYFFFNRLNCIRPFSMSYLQRRMTSVRPFMNGGYGQVWKSVGSKRQFVWLVDEPYCVFSSLVHICSLGFGGRPQGCCSF